MSPDSVGSHFLTHIINLSTSPINEEVVSSNSQFLIVQLLVLLLLIFINAFFSASEIAVITLNDNKIKKMADEGHIQSKKLLKLTENSSRFLSTIQVGVTLAGFLTSAIASMTFSKMLSSWLTNYLSLSQNAIETIATIIITLILSYFSLVLGELVPKKIAMQKSEEIAFKVVGMLNFVSALFSPFIKFLSASTNAVVRLLGLDPNQDEENVTEEEILMMVDVGEEKGVIEESAKDMIANIFDFDDTVASEIMTHRTEVTAVEDIDTIDDVIKVAINEGYSRIPVYHDDIDDILGIVYVKDLLKYVGQNLPNEINLTKIMRPAYFIPEVKKCSELFTEMSEKKLQMAVVCDEYGGTAGIVTMEDLLEAIVGNIQDEYDNEEEDITVLGENTYTVDGSTPLDEIDDLLEMELPDGDYDTIAGFLVEQLGRIPEENEKPVVNFKNIKFTVTKIEERRLSQILIEIEKPIQNDDENQ